MRPSGGLRVASGWASEQGRRSANEDYAGIYLPGGAGELARHGLVAAVADGVGGAKGGRVAAEVTVRGFIDGYYAQPDTIGIRSEEHTSELQSLMRISYAVFCLKKKKKHQRKTTTDDGQVYQVIYNKI